MLTRYSVRCVFATLHGETEAQRDDVASLSLLLSWKVRAKAEDHRVKDRHCEDRERLSCTGS